MKKTALIMAAAAAGVLLIAGAAFAAGPSMQGKEGQQGQGGMYNRPMFGPGPATTPGIFGTVTAVNGNTLTVNAANFRGPHPMATSTAPTSTTYTIDATNATVTKNGATSTVGAISVNDKVLVEGTVSGTTITAKAIVDGVTGNQPGGPIRGKFGDDGTSTWNNSSTWPTGFAHPTGSALAALKGNGEPVVGGTVTAVNGAMFTITNESNVIYSIDGTNATIVKGNATSSVSSVAVNDRIVVQGTVNGTAVTASTVIDQGAAPSKSGGNGTSTAPHGGLMGGLGGFFGGIGSFFHNLFGFF